MKSKDTTPSTPLLWEQAEDQRNGELEPVTPPAFEEFSTLSKLMDSLPEFVSEREIGNETVESTPIAQFKTLAELPLTGNPKDIRKLVPSIARKHGQNFTQLSLGDKRVDPARVDAQVFRDKKSPQLYVTVGINSVTSAEPQFNQYTVHDGHITDVTEPDKQLDDDEVTSVKMALRAVSEKIISDFEAVDQKRITRKLGAWSIKSAEKRATKRRNRRSVSEWWGDAIDSLADSSS